MVTVDSIRSVLGTKLISETEQIQRLIESGTVDFIRFEQPDIHGIARSKTVPIRHFERFATKGLNFPLPTFGLDVQGDTAPNTGVLEEIVYGDAYLFPDFSTLQVLPWADKTARVLGEPYLLDGSAVQVAPRYLAKRQIAELEKLGYQLLSGYEYEFYLVDAQTRQASTSGIQLFGTLPHADQAVIYQILRSLSAVGVDIITADLEYAPGQIEINFAPGWGIDGADRAYTFKNTIKEIAQQHGRIASFMTKPDIDQSANGCHFNQSLWDGERNVLLNLNQEHGLSEVALHYMAGQLAHAPALTALLSPTVNCWKRFKPNAFAPTNITWGIDNRTTAIRAKAFRDERTYIENRLGAGAANPYLVLAATLAAGIDGIKRQLTPPALIPGVADGLDHVPQLPTRLEIALEALEQDTVLREALGEPFIKLFTALKRYEIEKARQAITDYDTAEFLNRVDEWEIKEFFEVL
jgi:glutamine synthetase